MSCLLKYRWVKLPRALVPSGKGVLGYWARMAARAAFRAGAGRYCGHMNAVTPGMWSGGIVGVKSILGVRRRGDALRILDELQALGYITYTLDPATKKLEYRIRDWVLECSGEGCSDGAVYATDSYGFICLPRNITQRLADRKIKFGDADAWLDLWCHTVWQENSNAFSYMAPTVQFGTMGAALTLEALGRRWGWEKTKVWRFLRKYGDAFALYRLPGSGGCLIFNKLYPADTAFSLPESTDIVRIIARMRILAGNAHTGLSENECVNRLIRLCSGAIISELEAQSRVALFSRITRAYFSHCRNCESRVYDCRGVNTVQARAMSETTKRGSNMGKQKNLSTKSAHEPSKSDALIDFLMRRGVIADENIDSEKVRAARAEKQRMMFHNTRLLLENYRNIAWALACFPDTVADELEQPFESLDALLDRVDAEVGMGNRKLESRMESVRKSRLLLDRINEALSVLKRKPGNGEKLYELIYLTYIAPDKLTHMDLLFRLDLSSRHYYRLREQAIRIISLRLWSAHNSEADAWLEVLTLLEGMA